MSRIVLRGLGKRFGATPVLRGIDLTIERGEFCVFVGPSGCGKSTLLRILAGLEQADDGTLEFDGTTVNDLPPAQRGVAMVFQSYALYPHMSARENMAFGLRQRGVAAVEVTQRLRDAAAMLQLEALLERKPRDLSGGERQRVAIGRAIVRQPRILLLDEPLSNLDASLRLATRMRLAQLHRELGASTTVYVTHDQVEAMTLADRIVLLRPLRDGAHASVAQSGAPLELYHHPANRFAAGFIGAPPMNFLDGTIETVAEAQVCARVGTHRLCADVNSSGCVHGAPVTLGIRPEHITLDGGPLAARVNYVERLGESTTVHLDVAGLAPLLARSPRETIAVGDPLRIDLPAAAMHAFNADGTALPRPSRARQAPSSVVARQSP